MTRNGHRRPSARSLGAPRRATRFLIETLEGRQLLSTTAGTTDPVITPAISADTVTVTADWGWGWGGGGPGGPGGGGPGGGGGGGGGSGGGSGSGGGTTTSQAAMTPAELRAAYGFTSSNTGAGETIAIVDAYNDPNIQSDLAKFSSTYGLQDAAGTLTVVSQTGSTTALPKTDASWSEEIALDVEWAHAAAPNAKIVLVEANSASTSDLMAAVKYASTKANVVSMSWGSSEFTGEKSYDSLFATSGVTFVASAGDDGGASGASWPAASPNVLSVGGTTLTLTSSGTVASETAWSASGGRNAATASGSGGGTSTVETTSAAQAAALGLSATAKRETPDVSSDANPNTGLNVYDSVAGAGATGWLQIGGTSAGAPVWAGLVADADQARATAGLSSLSTSQTLSLLYSQYATAGKTATTYATDFNDITSGSNDVASAKTGYDEVTGLGTPKASAIISAAAKTSSVTTITTTTTKAAAAVAAVTVTAPASGTKIGSKVEVNVVATVATTTTVATTPVLTVAPVTTANLTTASGSAATTAGTAVAPTLTLSPPAQPVSGSDVSAPSETLTITEVAPAAESTESGPSEPGIFLEPAAPATGDEPVEALAARGLGFSAYWDDAIAVIADEEVPAPADGLFEADFEVNLSAPPNAAIVAGAAVLAWGAWRYQSRRGRDRKTSVVPTAAPTV